MLEKTNHTPPSPFEDTDQLRILSVNDITPTISRRIALLINPEASSIKEIPTYNRATFSLPGFKSDDKAHNMYTRFSKELFGTTEYPKLAKEYVTMIEDGISHDEAREAIQNLYHINIIKKEQALPKLSPYSITQEEVLTLRRNLDKNAISIRDIPMGSQPLGLSAYLADDTFVNFLTRCSIALFNNTTSIGLARDYLGFIEDGLSNSKAQKRSLQLSQIPDIREKFSLKTFTKESVELLRNALDTTKKSIRDISVNNRKGFSVEKYRGEDSFGKILIRLSTNLFGTASEVGLAREFLALLEDGIEKQEAETRVQHFLEEKKQGDKKNFLAIRSYQDNRVVRIGYDIRINLEQLTPSLLSEARSKLSQRTESFQNIKLKQIGDITLPGFGTISFDIFLQKLSILLFNNKKKSESSLAYLALREEGKDHETAKEMVIEYEKEKTALPFNLESINHDLITKILGQLATKEHSIKDISTTNKTIIFLKECGGEITFQTFLSMISNALFASNFERVKARNFLQFIQSGKSFEESKNAVLNEFEKDQELKLPHILPGNITPEIISILRKCLDPRANSIREVSVNNENNFHIRGFRNDEKFSGLLSRFIRELLPNTPRLALSREYLALVEEGKTHQEALTAIKVKAILDIQNKLFSLETINQDIVKRIEKCVCEPMQSLEDVSIASTKEITIEGFEEITFSTLLRRLNYELCGNNTQRTHARNYLILLLQGFTKEQAIERVKEQFSEAYNEEEKIKILKDFSLDTIDQTTVIAIRNILKPGSQSIGDIGTKNPKLIQLDGFKPDKIRNILIRLSRALFHSESMLSRVKEYLVYVEQGKSKDEALNAIQNPSELPSTSFVAKNTIEHTTATEDTIEKPNIEAVFDSQKQEQTIIQEKKEKIFKILKKQSIRTGAMIDLMDGINFLLFSPVKILETSERKTLTGQENSNIYDLNTEEKPNPLQELRYKMIHAIRSENWDDVTLLYLEYYTYLPAFLEHILSVRYLTETFNFIPKNALSIASGPLEEEFAWYAYLLGIKKEESLPTVYNIDNNELILDLGRDTQLSHLQKLYPHITKQIWDKFGNKHKNRIGDMRNFDTLLTDMPTSFDLIECSSLDNIGTEDYESFCMKMDKCLLGGGYIKLVHRHPIPDTLKKFLHKRGYIFHDTVADRLYMDTYGSSEDQKQITQRMKQKLKHSHILIARKPSSSDSSHSNLILRLSIREKEPDFNQELLKNINEVVQKYTEEQGGIEKLSDKDINYLNSILQKYSYNISKNSRKNMLIYSKISK